MDTQPTSEPCPSEQTRFAAIVEYDGTGLGGWQRQPNAVTLQEQFESALYRLYGIGTRVAASGRTDAGVHARGQVVHFDAVPRYPAAEVRSALNHFLPEHMAIVFLREVAPDFHARFHAAKKEYSYSVVTAEVRPVIQRLYSWHHREQVDVHTVRKALALLDGEVDVAPFASEPGRASSTVRRFFRAELAVLSGERLEFRFCANGFLYNLVRALVGTAMAIGRGRMTPDDMALIIQTGDRSLVPALAPPHGLVLEWVEYDRYPDLRRVITQ